MSAQIKKRKYTQRRRAESQQETRDRIIEAAMRVHEQAGPAYASIKGIAEKAGVQRLTVYRHFKDDFSLFHACTSHWLTLNPPPDASVIDSSSPDKVIKSSLLTWYKYYASTERMWTVSYRDVDLVEAVQEPMANFESYLDEARDNILALLKLKGKEKSTVSLILRHCLSFTTWKSFKDRNASNEKIADLAVRWIIPSF